MPQDEAHDDEYTNPGRGWVIGGGLGILLWIVIYFSIRNIIN